MSLLLLLTFLAHLFLNSIPSFTSSTVGRRLRYSSSETEREKEREPAEINDPECTRCSKMRVQYE